MFGRLCENYLERPEEDFGHTGDVCFSRTATLIQRTKEKKKRVNIGLGFFVDSFQTGDPFSISPQMNWGRKWSRKEIRITQKLDQIRLSRKKFGGGVGESKETRGSVIDA